MGPTRRGAMSSAVAFVSSVLLCACVASPTIQTARSGSLATLRAEIARERSKCTLEPAEVRELARITAERELAPRPASSAAADGAPDGLLARIDEARGCTRAVSGPLRRLASATGDVGAAATLALLDGGMGDADGTDAIRRYGSSPNAAWRSVAARSAKGDDLGDERRRFFTDGDERVRLAALRAAIEAKDGHDAHPLLEVARLDPNALARALAVRALGAIASDETVLSLRDLYARADEPLRQSIVDAWGIAAAQGGTRELVRTVETERGAPAIEAGSVLLRRGSEPRWAAIGIGVLVRGMDEDLARDRLLAVLDAPTADPRVVDALRKAASASEPTVAAAAWSRLAELPSSRKQALDGLARLARGGSRDALYTLARLGDAWALREVARDLASPRAEARVIAARTLVSAGDLARAADALADDDARVRMTVACAVLSSTRDD